MATKLDCLERGHNWIDTIVTDLYQCGRCGYYRSEEHLKRIGEL